MDVHSKAWMRVWLIGAATAGLVGPELQAGDGYRPHVKPARAASSASQNPASRAIIPAAYEQPADEIVLAQSEVEQQLRQLYERDGREMPNLNMTPAPAAQQPTQGSPTAGSPARLQRSAPPRYSPAPPVRAPKSNPNKVTSFFKRLIPGGNKKTQAQAAPVPPRQLPQAPTYQPAHQQPRPNYDQPAAPQVLPQSAPAQTAVIIPPSPVQSFTPVTLGDPGVATVPPFVSESNANTTRRIPLPAAAEVDVTVLPTEPDAGFGDAEIADEEFETPIQVEASPAEAAPPRLDDDFPDPFGAAAESQAAPEEEETNPYSGKALDEQEAPATLPDETEFQPVSTSAHSPADESTAAKMRRVIQRADMKGLKGFCPVTLRDQRELADARSQFSSTFRGQKFNFATKEAQVKFEEDPARYAPAAYGADVVVLTDDQDVVEGTLDFAAWYKGRLYLFGSRPTHDLFVVDPDRYATPPGIE